jgi:hypothetical protein
MITRTTHLLHHDPGRVIAKPYLPGEEIANDATTTRAGLLLARIGALSEAEVAVMLERTLEQFAARHKHLEGLLERHFEMVAHLADGANLSRARRLLIGA